MFLFNMQDLLTTPLGIEIETMLVDGKTLDVLPKVDAVLTQLHGTPTVEHVDGPITWSNELVNHVIEFKVSKPVPISEQLATDFHASIDHFRKGATASGGVLLPTGMHPWMNPATQTQLWPGEYHEHYATYHSIFNCFTHGFANLQSVHINIPFHDEDEFGRLSAAIRLVLPLIPALGAASPIRDGVRSPQLNGRLEVYRTNQKLVESVAGKVIPEPIFDTATYKSDILQKMYTDVAPFDPNKILQTEQLNSRGCIARFDRNTLEIRLIDAQECSYADIAVASAVVYLVNELLHEKWLSYEQQKQVDTNELYKILTACIKDAEGTKITSKTLLSHFGLENEITAGKLLSGILAPHVADLEATAPELAKALNIILKVGTLSSRILRHLPEMFTKDDVFEVYTRLSECQLKNKLFE